MPGRLEIKTIAMLLLLFTPVADARAVDLRTQTLRYDVMYRNHHAGELEVRIERNGDEIKTTAINHPGSLARLFLDSQTIETWFRLGEDGAELLRGQTRATESGAVTGGYEIDRQAGKIRLSNAQDIAFTSGELLAAASFPIALMTMDMPQVKGVTVHEVTDKKTRFFIYDSVAKESIRMDGELFNAWKIVRSRRDDSTRTVTYWLDRENNHIPIKIVVRKKDRETVLSLKS